MQQLAIIIPAYKKDFLRQCLASVLAQSRKDFHLYVFDDNSPDPLKSIISEFATELPLTYRRFNENLGTKNLAGHWTRCVQSTQGEPWIWIFSDDDLMAPDSVAAFYERAEKKGLDKKTVYRFPMDVIDADNHIISESEPWPERISSADFLNARLNFALQSSVNEYIFSRESFEREGFQPYPMAWCTDDAAWISFSENGGIISLEKGRVGWRKSHVNISNDIKELSGERKLHACIQFLDWLQKRAAAKPFLSISKVQQQHWLAQHWLMLRIDGKLLPPVYGYRVYRENLKRSVFMAVLWKVVVISLKNAISKSCR